MRVPADHTKWLNTHDSRVRVGPVGETAYTERLAQALATENAGGTAAFSALVPPQRRDIHDLVDGGATVVYVATFNKGPDLLVAVGKGDDCREWRGVVVEHKRLGNSHARSREYYQRRWPEGRDNLCTSEPYNFDQKREAFTLSGLEGMWQLDAAWYFPSDWLPVDLVGLPLTLHVFMDAKNRGVTQAFCFEPTDNPEGAEGPPQSAEAWESLGYEEWGKRLRDAHFKLSSVGDCASAATLVPLISTLYKTR